MPDDVEAGDAEDLYEFEGDIDPAFYAHGGISISGPEQAALGDLHGKSVLVVQAGNGEDILSLMNLGASVTVIDEAGGLDEARTLAAAATMEPQFIEDKPGDISVAAPKGGYDIVYSGFGGLSWINDLGRWATGVNSSLRRGGTLVVYDEHPFARVFEPGDEGNLVVAHSYLADVDDDEDDEEAEVAEPTATSTPDDDKVEDEDASSWTIGDLICSLGAAGLVTLSLLELPDSDRFATPLDEMSDDVDYEELVRIPGVLLLAAMKM